MYDSKTARDKYTLKKPQVSIVLNSDWAEPLRIKGCEEQKCSYHDDDIQASKNQMDFMLGWWLHSVMFGSWPKSMNERVYINRIKTIKQPQLGQFADSSCLQEDGKPVTCSQKSQLKLTDDIRAGGTLDALAINHYTGYFVVDMNYPNFLCRAGSSVRFSGFMARRDDAATYMLQGGATRPWGRKNVQLGL